MKLLLINPKFPESFWSFSWALNKIVRDKRAINSPLGLATLAALTPQDWEIIIVDENVEPINYLAKADIVGVCGMGVQFPRQKEILNHFRGRGIYTVAGGSYASLCFEEYEGLVDTVISGEAEYIWPKFCADFIAGRPQKLYRETESVDMALSPPPRYDLLDLSHYQKISLQFSRGCPFQCEFCDIIVMFGRKPRTKTLTQVERELDGLRAQKVTNIFFVDDNLIGNKPVAKQLLKFLVDYQKKHHYRFTFGTEASINMADDTELMSLFKKANFEWVFIGIETPSIEGLKETKKTQNLRGDLLSSIRTIYSYGMDIFAGFIIGFDSDDKTIFERQYNFIVSSGITMAMVGLLCAMPKTPLYSRLEKSGRLRGEGPTPDNTRPMTNVIPLKMTYDELVSGYKKLYGRLLKDRVSYQRISNKVRYLKNPLVPPYFSLGQRVKYLWRLFFFGILPGGLGRLYFFLRSLAPIIRNPKTIAPIITDWITLLSLKAFWVRSFNHSPSRTRTTLQNLQNNLLARIKESWQEGLVASNLSFFKDREHIWVHLKHSLDLKVSQVLARVIRRTLKKSREPIVIDCHQLGESSLTQLQFLFRKLKRYREQIHIRITESLYQPLRLDLALFHCSLVVT